MLSSEVKPYFHTQFFLEFSFDKYSLLPWLMWVPILQDSTMKNRGLLQAFWDKVPNFLILVGFLGNLCWRLSLIL